MTGGSRGLGLAAAEALAGDGARVVLSSPHEATASAAAARLSQNAASADSVTRVVADNGDPTTPYRLIAAAKDRFGRLDGALVSVGGTPPGTIATTTDEAWRSAFESVPRRPQKRAPCVRTRPNLAPFTRALESAVSTTVRPSWSRFYGASSDSVHASAREYAGRACRRSR